MPARVSQALRKKLVRLETLLRERPAAPILDLLRRQPGHLMLAAGMTPDPWQQKLLDSRAERILMLASRQCFDADTVVLDRQGRAMRIRHHPDAWPTGLRHVRRYTVRGGAAITVTDNHPLFTPRGWVPAASIHLGDRIAVLSAWDRWESPATLEGYVEHGRYNAPRPAHVSFPVGDDLGKFLGYMMTDGSNRPGQSIKFTNTRRCYLDEMERLVETLTGVRAKHYAKGTGEDLLFTRHDNRLMDLMRLLRWDERFPTDLFRFPQAVVAAAVNRAWAGDGCVRQGRSGHPEVFLACKNEIYGRYFQLLLMKLGVHSRLTWEWQRKCTRTFHRLVLGCGRANIQRFFQVVGPIYGKEARSEAVLAYVEQAGEAQDYRLEDHHGEDGETFHLAPVVRIDDLGHREVWDVAVPGKGWLVAQGIKAHNSGKSTVAASLAMQTALLQPRSPVLLLSPTLRQSGEIFRKVLDVFNALGRPVAVTGESALRLELANGSRVISLPGTEGTVRGYSGVAMLIIDEAARVDDALYFAVRPMLAVSQGRLVALSTPFGKRGWFYEEWSGTAPWERVRITADQCPRITPQFLAEERLALGERFYLQEYGTLFSEVIDAVFSSADIAAALSEDVKPLFGS